MDTENFVPPAEPAGPAQPQAPQASGPVQEQTSGAKAASNGQGQFRGNRRRRRFRRQHGPKGRQQKQHQPNQQNRGNGNGNGNAAHHGPSSVFTAPMDHSYRQSNGDIDGNTTGAPAGGRNQRRFGRGGFRQNNQRGGMPPAALGSPQIEPVPQNPDALGPRIFAFVEDLFFVIKMNETARKLNVRLDFVKSMDELLEKAGEEKPSLIIVDLNNANLKPLTVIPKLRSHFKKGTSILGFVPHVQGDLKVKAQEVGCDSVMPRSAFSANLPQLLRRHGAPEEQE